MNSNNLDIESNAASDSPINVYGVSIVICCHNSATRIAETLNCLQTQKHCHNVPWEVVLVDNGCTDETVDLANAQWEKNPVVALKVVTENKLGLSNARIMGISAATFEIISFIDDDNRVDPDWICQLPDLFETNTDMAAVGGLVMAGFESTEPTWFREFEPYFAVGPQARAAGELDDFRGYLCGAGFTVRKSVLTCLFANGFRFELVGRQGQNLLCSEDLELCLALKLAGWKLWYCPSLKMIHFMTDTRMSWSYIKRLARGVGISLSGLKPYYVILGNSNRHAQVEWVRSTTKAVMLTIYYSFKKLSCLGRNGVGRDDDLQFERAVGLLQGMFLRRKQFISSIERLRRTPFSRCSPRPITNQAVCKPSP